MLSKTFFALFALVAVPHVLAHGVVTSPTPRTTGAASEAACGKAVTKKLASDKYGPIQDAQDKADDGYDEAACSLYFCRGYKYEDNEDKLQTYSVGEVVPFKIDLEAHHTGLANVSVVDVVTQSLIGEPLKNWPVYANESLGPADWPKDETDFSVTIPDLTDQCSEAGACAIQWWWYGTGNDQTYESCIDFVIGSA
ncbi:hypothetical protein HDZ31DRAFT_65763 [Schizophyllum fasciatum]